MKTKFTLILLAIVAVFTLSFVSTSNQASRGNSAPKTEVTTGNEPIGGFSSADQL